MCDNWCGLWRLWGSPSNKRLFMWNLALNFDTNMDILKIRNTDTNVCLRREVLTLEFWFERKTGHGSFKMPKPYIRFQQMFGRNILNIWRKCDHNTSGVIPESQESRYWRSTCESLAGPIQFLPAGQRLSRFPGQKVGWWADWKPAFPFHKSVTRCLKLLLVPWSYDHRACYMLIETSKLKSTRKQNGNLPMTLGSSHWSSWPCNANSLATTKCQIGIIHSSIDLAKNQDISPSDSHEPNKNDQSPSDLHPISIPKPRTPWFPGCCFTSP